MNVTVDFQHVIFQHVTFQRGDGPPARRNFDRTSKVNTRHSFATCRHPSVLHLRLRYSTPHFPQTQRATVPTTMKKFSLCEALEDWYFNKSQITIKSYKQRIKDMSRWMKENYGETRDIDTMRKRHIRLYINSKAGTATQLRPLKCAIKSCFKHLCKRGVIKIDPAKDFESGKQNPPKFERNLSASDVRLFFKEASKKNDQRTHVMLQILCYGGLRLKVLSQLPCSSIIRTEFLKNKKKDFHYSIAVKKAKGNKSRRVALRKDIGLQVYNFAQLQSKSGVYLFPGKNKNKPMHPQSVSGRVKRIAKKVFLMYQVIFSVIFFVPMLCIMELRLRTSRHNSAVVQSPRRASTAIVLVRTSPRKYHWSWRMMNLVMMIQLFLSNKFRKKRDLLKKGKKTNSKMV